MTNSTRAKILVTGATGNVGRELTQQLSAQNVRFRAMTRSGKNGAAFADSPNVETILGDFNDRKSIARALEGVERAFLLTDSSEQAETQQTDFVEEASRAGVKHIVKLSQWAADANSPVRFLRYHAAVEQKIVDSGLDYTFLRPNLFMQGLLAFRDSIVNQGKFFASVGEAQISVVDVRDIAAVAAAALTEDGHANKIYNITGGEALSHAEMAAKLSAAINRPIRFIDVPPETMREELIKHNIPVWQSDGLVEDYAHYRRGEAAAIEAGVKDATGKEPRAFDDFARHYAPAFS